MNTKITKKNHLSVESKLKSYTALAAGLIAFANNSEAQMVYTDSKPDTTISNNGSYLLDLNGDGTNDFQLTQLKTTSSYKSYFKINRVTISPLGQGNKILDTINSANPYPPALNLNTSIGPNPKHKRAWTGPMNSLLTLNSDRIKIRTSTSSNLPFPPVFNGNWQGVNDKFLGLSFEFKGNTYYGWVRLDVAKDAKSFTVKSYGYDSIPNEPVLAGDTVITNIKKNNELPLKTVIYTHGKDLYVNFNSAALVSGKINLFSISGQLLKSSELVTLENHVKLEDIASGVYILNIQTSKGNLARKIQIQ